MNPTLKELTDWCISSMGRIFQEWDWWWAGEGYKSKFSYSIHMRIRNTPNESGANICTFGFKSEEGLVLFKMRWLY